LCIRSARISVQLIEVQDRIRVSRSCMGIAWVESLGLERWIVVCLCLPAIGGYSGGMGGEGWMDFVGSLASIWLGAGQ